MAGGGGASLSPLPMASSLACSARRIRAAEDGGPSNFPHAPGAVLGAESSQPARSPARTITSALHAPSSLTYLAREKQPMTIRAAEDGGPSIFHHAPGAVLGALWLGPPRTAARVSSSPVPAAGAIASTGSALQGRFEYGERLADLGLTHDQWWNPADDVVPRAAGEQHEIVLQAALHDRLGSLGPWLPLR